MTLLSKAHITLLGLVIVVMLAACGPAAATATPTATMEPTLPPTNTPPPTETPAPTETPVVIPTSPDGAGTGVTDPNAAPTQPPPANPSAGGTAPDKYEYLGQDITDGTQFLPGRTLTITWTVKNAGTNGWTKDYTLRHFSGPKPEKDVYTFTKDVPAGATINFVVTFTTPAEPGTYDMWFKLTNLQGQNFGDLDLVYTVSNNPQKLTPTTSSAATVAPQATAVP